MIPLVQSEDRSCGECQLCCKLLGVREFNKPHGVWCPHVGPPGRGCAIYDDRPESCRGFTCLWLASGISPPELRPDKIKGVMVCSPDGHHIVLFEDTGYQGKAHAALARLLNHWIDDGTRYYVVVTGKQWVFYGNTDLLEQAKAMMAHRLDGGDNGE